MVLPTIGSPNISVLKGNITNLKHTFYIGGQNGSMGNMATFEIDSQPILLLCNHPILLDTMDEVAVSGSKKQGIFYSSTYCNFTKKTYSPPPFKISYIISGILCTIGALAFILFTNTFHIIPLLCALLFGFLGYNIYSDANHHHEPSYQLILDIVKNNPIFDYSD